MDSTAAFARYETLRPRMPAAKFPDTTVQIDSLLDIVEQADVFVFDAYGVLNVGEAPIAGAAARIEQLRNLGKQVCTVAIVRLTRDRIQVFHLTEYRRLVFTRNGA